MARRPDPGLGAAAGGVWSGDARSQAALGTTSVGSWLTGAIWWSMGLGSWLTGVGAWLTGVGAWTTGAISWSTDVGSRSNDVGVWLTGTASGFRAAVLAGGV